MKRLVLIDGKSVFYRGYYAMGALSLSDGTPTGGVYGFAAIAMEIVRELNPTKVVVAWDSKTSTSKRRAIFPDYKAGRVKPGEDFYAQIPLLEALIRDLGWNFIEIPNYEADDIIGSLSLQADEMGSYETYIISSDLDMLQIVDDNTHMWRILKGFTNIEQIDIPEIETKYGIKKSQFLDLKSLKGDSSDNIPGVPGIGEKTAAKLLSEYGDLDGIYNNIDKITGSTRKKLEVGKDSAYMSRDLARIMFDAPVNLAKIPDFHFDRTSVISGLKKLEFNSLIRKIEKETSKRSDGVFGNAEGEIVDPEKDMSDTPANSLGDMIIAWDIKSLMHSNNEIASKILSGSSFWDISQAAFLLNPLSRDEPRLVVPEEEYRRQLTEFKNYPKLYQVYTELDLPLIPILYKMEKKGMLIDRHYFEKLRKEYSEEVQQLEQQIYSLAGRNFNVNSPIQLSEVLFTNLGLPTKGIKKTTRGYSTGAKELDKLKDLHPLIPKLMEYREAAKLLSTYIVPMPTLADEFDRIHTTFTQNITATGRLSSKDPNLQNIPVRTEEGKRIRTGFIAPEGRMLVSADYSQFELRLAAILSNDQTLIDDFNHDIDIHTKTASEAFNVPMSQVTKAQRRAAKVINFGILYGMGAFSLSQDIHVSVRQANQYIQNYMAQFPSVGAFMEKTVDTARINGYVTTYFQRRRPVPELLASNKMVQAAGKRIAMNTPIQGTAADIIKLAMIYVYRRLQSDVPDAKLILQVHDELIVEVPEQHALQAGKVLGEEMQNVIRNTLSPEEQEKFPVPLTADVSMGESWYAAKG